MTSGTLTEHEHEALRDPRVARGAQIEARVRRRALGRHEGLVGAATALARHHPEMTDAEIACLLLRIYSDRSRVGRLRWAWLVYRRASTRAPLATWPRWSRVARG